MDYDNLIKTVEKKEVPKEEYSTLVDSTLDSDMDRQDLSTFINFINEDKSGYPTATSKGFKDKDGDFLVGDSGGFLKNKNFVFRETWQLRKAAAYYEEHGVYTHAEEESPLYEQFRLNEEHSRKDGVTFNCKLLKTDIALYNSLPHEEAIKLLKPLHITGEHYNFINYGRINKLVDVNKNGTIVKEKEEGFPHFFDSQYWWMKVKEFAIINGFNLPVGKSRRAGFSFMEGIDTANDANLYPNRVGILAAYDKKYLTKKGGISIMAQTQLNFYEQHTPFNRCGRDKDGNAIGLLSKDVENMIVGYKTSSGIPSGYLSSIFSVSFGPNQPDAAIGKDAKKVKIEELSNTPNLFDFLKVTNPTTTTGAYKTGIIIGFGTGGSKEGSWAEFEKWFYELPYDAMPFENVWDNNMRHTKCGFFKPYIEALEGKTQDGREAMDKDGNSLYEIAAEISDFQRWIKKISGSLEDYVGLCAQHSNTPSETFSSSMENIFTSPELNLHIERVKHDDSLKWYRDGMIVLNPKGIPIFKTNERLGYETAITHPYITNVPLRKGDDPHGCIREIFAPYRDENGDIPDNLYRISYDPFAIDKDKNEVTSKHSLASIKVRMVDTNITGSGGDMIVAAYAGRPNTTEEADKICMLLCMYYNAKALPEVDRGDTVKNFRKWGMLKYLIKEPIHVFDKSVKGKTESSYGIVIGTGQKKLDALQYQKEWLYKKRSQDEDGKFLYNLNFVYDLPYLLELQKWNIGGNFDRVSDFNVAVFDMKESEIKKLKVVKATDKKKDGVFNRPLYK